MSTAGRWVAIVLAAGHGTRMRSRTPKVAHRIAGRPIVRHVIEAARAAGVDDVVVVVGTGADAALVREAAGSDVRFALQPEPRGTGDAVWCARELAVGSDRVLIMNGDVPLVTPETLAALMKALDRADLTALTAAVPVEAYGVLETEGERIVRIIETKAAEGVDRAEIRLINSGQYAARSAWLWSHLEHVTPAPNGERYLTQLAAMAYDEGNPAVAVTAGDPSEVRGINDRVQLAEAEASMRDRICRRHMLAGVTIADPPSTFIDAEVTIGGDTIIEAGSHLLGGTRVGADCVIGPASVLREATVGDSCSISQSTIEESTLESGVEVGPYSHLRPGSYICEGAHIGNFAEIKASRLGRRTKMGHHSYIGDADVGDDVNIGAGTITANYDGARKHRTVIGDGAFIGTDTMLVAPVRLGAGARTGAGSVVTRDVPPGTIAIGAPARIRSLAPGEEESGPG